MPHEELQFWHFNVPVEQRTAECPEYLLNLTEKDQRLIGAWDSDYMPLTWNQVKELVGTNRIDLFSRSPTALRRYRNFTHLLTIEYGSVLSFIQHNRLHWTNLTPDGAPFTNPDDYKILYNDWPYGIDPRVIHLVVWTKFALPDDPDTGVLTLEAKNTVERFVDKTFRSRVGYDNVIWFKNWKSLKSVHAIEHFHVMTVAS